MATTTPSQSDIDYLKAHPDQAANFDSAFGEGASAKFMTQGQDAPAPEAPVPTEASQQQPQAQPQNQPQPQPEQPSLLDKVGNVASDMAQGGKEIITGKVPLASVENAWNETLKAAGDVGDWLDNHVVDGKITFDIPFVPNDKQVNLNPENLLSIGQDYIPDIKSRTGQIAEGIGRFVVGMVGAKKFLSAFGMAAPATTAGKVLLEGGAAATAGATVFDPHQERLSNLINEYPWLRNAVTEYLASDPKDSNLEGRFKNALESIGLDAVAQPFMYALRALKAGKSGNMAEAVKELDQTEAALPKQTEAQPQAQPKPDVTDPQVPGIQPEQVQQKVAPASQEAPKPNQTNASGQQEMFASGDMGPKQANPQTNPLNLAVDQSSLNKLDVLKMREMGYRYDGIDINWDYVNTPEEAKRLFNAISVAYKDQRDALVRAGDGKLVKSQDQVMTEAKDLLSEFGVQDVPTGLQNLTKMYGDVKDMDALVTAHRMMLGNLGRTVEELGAVVHDPLSNPDLVAKWTKKYPTKEAMDKAFLAHNEALINYALTFKGVQTNIARAMRSMGYLPDTMGNAVVRGLDVTKMTAEEARNMAAKLAAARKVYPNLTPGQLVRITSMSKMQRAWGIFNEYYINSLLSGTKTQAVQAMSSAAMTAYKPLEDGFAGVLTGNPVLLKEAARRYIGIGQGLKDGLTTFLHTLVNDPKQVGKDTWHVITSDNVHSIDPSINQEHGLGGNISAPMTGTHGLVGSAIDALGTVVRTPTRMMANVDSVFKALNYRGYVYAKAMREAEALAESKGLAGKAKADFIGQQVSDTLDKAFDNREYLQITDPATGQTQQVANPNFGKATNAEGVNYGREITFTQDLEYGVGKGLSFLTSKHPGLKVIIPFIKTPTNILRFVWQRTPLINIAQRQWREDFLAGGERRAKAIAKMTIGTSLYGLGAYLAHNGQITGAMPKNPDVRKTMQDAGQQPYSVVVNNADGSKTYIPYNRTDPFGMFLGLAADMTNLVGHYGDKDMEELAMGAVTALANNLSSKTYLQNLINLSNAISDGDRYGPAFVKNLLSPVVPNILNSFNTDDTMREARSIVDTWMQKVPGLSDNLAPRFDNFGVPFMKPGGWPDNAINPFAFTKSNPNDLVRNEMSRLSGGDANIVFALPPKKQGTIDLLNDRYKSANGYTAWDRMMAMRGTLKVNGKTLYEAVDNLIRSPQYLNAPDPGPLYRDSVKSDMIKKVIQRYDNAIWMQMRKSKAPEDQRLQQDFMLDFKQRIKAKLKGEQGLIDINQQ